MKRRSAPNPATHSKKPGATRRESLAPVEAGPWAGSGEMGPREFPAETSLSTSGGDFGFRPNGRRAVR